MSAIQGVFELNLTLLTAKLSQIMLGYSHTEKSLKYSSIMFKKIPMVELYEKLME